MKQVASSNIEMVKHDPATNVMTVKFIGGGTYRYADVPADLFDRFIKADSLGKFFHAEVRGKFDTTKDDPEPKPEAEQKAELLDQLRRSVDAEPSK